MSVAVSADFEFPAVPRYLAAAPITHVAGTKVVPALLRGGLSWVCEDRGFLKAVSTGRHQ